MSSREPMWFCHECHAEMRPLMMPDPHCASCHGTFVEKLENPADDPREFQHGAQDDLLTPDLFFAGLQNIMRAPRSTNVSSGSPPTTRSRGTDRPTTTGNHGFTIRVDRTGSPGRTRTMVFGVPQRRNSADNVPTLSDNTDGGTQDRQTISGALMAQYLLALLGNRVGPGPADPFSEMFEGLMGGGVGGPENGRWGDYVFNQEALDQIITHLMENSNASAPVPATEEIIEKLPREVLEEGSPLPEKDCAVCKEQFKLGTEDPDEQVVITLPCKHPFHEGCILPWLKSSGTCPVCRHQLIPQPTPHGPDARPPGNSGPQRPASPQRGPSPSSSQGGGLFNSLFAYVGGTHGNGGNSSEGANNRSGGNSRSGANTGSGRSTGTRPPGGLPGGWDDVD